MTSPVFDLVFVPDSPTVHRPLPTTTAATATTTTTTIMTTVPARPKREQLSSDLAEARKKKKKRQGSPKTPSGSLPHPPPPPAGPSGTSGASGASGSSQSPPPPLPLSNTQGVSPIPEELHMGDYTTADKQAYSSSSEDVGRDRIPTINLRQSWWKPITEDRPATPEPA
ncbi:hypothetical protein Tco_1364348 [Tanacetum coccineum]